MATISASTASYHDYKGAYEDEKSFEEAGSFSAQSNSGEGADGQLKQVTDAMREIMALLTVDEELADVHAAEEAMIAKGAEREGQVQILHDEVLGLQRKLEKAKIDAQRPPNQPTSSAHKIEVLAIERQSSQMTKQLKEEQMLVRKKEEELAKWKAEKEQVAKMEVGDEGEWADGKVIRITLFKEAGFTLIPGKDNSAAKVLIRDDAKSDIHTVQLDKSRSRAWNANMIWGLASGQ